MSKDEGAVGTPEVHGYRHDEHQYFHICRACCELYEEGQPDGENQQCRCRPHLEKTWSGALDFDQRAILCRCCGLVVLPSGLRWHPFFCRECQLMAMGVSVWHRSLIFPIGRHSVMHTWVPKTPSPSLQAFGGDQQALANAVYDAIRAVSRGSDGLWDWYPIVMRRNLEALGLEGDVLLSQYDEAIDRAELSVLRSRLIAFEGLCEFFKRGVAVTESGELDG